MRKIAIFGLGLILSCFLYAEITPTPKPLDKRITSVKYDPNNVVRVRTKIGITTLIQLQKGEGIGTNNSGMGIGDVEAWGIDIRGNNIFIKPTAENPDTNLTIVTNKGRTYSFALILSKWPHYKVSLEYEKPKPVQDMKNDMPCSDGDVNFNYQKWGDDSLAPSYMWDDGRFTCLKFGRNPEIPLAYKVSPDGKESLINYHFEKDIMVLQGISREYRLRLGKDVLGIISEDAVSSGHNSKATSINAKRVLNDE